MWEFIRDRQDQILVNALGHVGIAVLSVLLATAIALVLAVGIARIPKLEPVANALTTIGLTIPSFALIGLLLPLTGIGTTTAFICVTFYAVLPILRNAVVGLSGVDDTLIESARGLGMSEVAVLRKVQLPLAWPVILAGIRLSTQMTMGIAAIAAYVLGPGFGGWIFTGLAQLGGANAVYYAFVGTVGVVILALVLDLLLLLLGRLTISKGIRVA